MRRRYRIHDDDLDRGQDLSRTPDSGIGSKISYGAGFAIGVVSGILAKLKDKVKSLIQFFQSSDNPNSSKALKVCQLMLKTVNLMLSLLAGKLTATTIKMLRKQASSLSDYTRILGGFGMVASGVGVIKVLLGKLIKALDKAIVNSANQPESRLARDSMFRRRNMRYRDSIRRRRVMDRVARHIKYNDGIKDIIDNLKNKINEAIANFKSLPTGKKVAVLLTKTLQIVMGILAAKNVAKLAQNIKTLKSVKAQLAAAGDDPDFQKEKALSQAGGAVVAYTSLKVIVSLLGVLIASVTAKLAVAQKQVQEGEDEERVVSEAMTR